MPRCAFLTMDSLENFEAYDELLIDPMASLGWEVDMVSWRAVDPDWDRYRAVVIRSPWDYQQDVEQFLDVLQQIDQSSARLENPLSLVRWNIDKSYLRDVEKKGVPIVPTLWRDSFDAAGLSRAFDRLDTDELIIKPRVSANADDTYRIKNPADDKTLKSLEKTFSTRPYLVQPFMDSILHEGEYSLFFFGEQYSHTIVKRPASGDFRVQEEHGGRLQTIEADELLMERSRKVMDILSPNPLYARVDMVRTNDDDYALMELELIEPSLYFNMDPDSPERFAKVFDRWMKNPPNNPQ